MNDINYLFTKYQKPLVDGLNHWALGTPFRKLLGIDKECKGKIYKLYDNSYHTRLGKNKFQSTSRCYPIFAKRIGIALSKWDIVKDYISGNPKFYQGLDEYRGLLAELGLLNTREFPTVMAASPETFYPTASSADGSMYLYRTAQQTWATFRALANCDSVVHDAKGNIELVRNAAASAYCCRGIFNFDTSGIGSGTVTGTVLSLCSAGAVGDADSSSVVFTGNTVLDEDSLVVSDFSRITLNTPTEYATRATLASISGSDGTYNDFTFNDNGKDAVIVDGWTKICTRISNDVDNSSPSGIDSFYHYTSAEAGTDKDPKLVVTYTAGGGGANAGWKSLLGVGL